MTTEIDEPIQPPTAEPESRNRFAPVVLAVGLVLALGIAAVALVNRSDDGGATAEGPDSDLLALAFTTEDGTQGTLSDYLGQPLVVNFFASWCPPCRAEMPDFEEVHRSGEAAIIGVNSDFDEPTWRSFVDQAGVTFPTVYQPNQEIYEALGGVFMPTTAFLDADGTVLGVHAGAMTADQLRSSIEDYFGSSEGA